MLPSKIFLDDFFSDLDSMKSTSKMMKCDIYEQNNNYMIEVDIPGYKKEDIHLEYENGYIKIKVEKQEKDEEDKKYIRRERKLYEQYERSFYVGQIEEDKIKANFENGILKLTVPKEETEIKRKRIEID